MEPLNPILVKTLHLHFRILVTMSHEDLLKAVIYVVHGLDTPRADASRYSVSNRNILEIEIKLESTQEERDTPLVEHENQQHIYIWVPV